MATLERSRQSHNPSTSNLYDLLQDSPTQMWWIRHGIIRREASDQIDWEGTHAMMHHLTPGERRYVTKAASANCGVGATLVQWKFQVDALCPRCTISFGFEKLAAF